MTYSLKLEKITEGRFRGIVFNDETNYVHGVAESEAADTLLDFLFSLLPIDSVRMKDGTRDAGDELSVREVAECVALAL